MSDDQKGTHTGGTSEGSEQSGGANPQGRLLAEQRKNLTSEPGPIQVPPTAQFKPSQGDEGASGASTSQGHAGGSGGEGASSGSTTEGAEK
jgi:hypothetical protein